MPCRQGYSLQSEFLFVFPVPLPFFPVLRFLYPSHNNREALEFANTLFLPDESIESLNSLRKTLSKITGRKEEAKVMIQFKNGLINSPEKDFLLYQFDFISWAESKIQNRSFAEMMRSREKLV